MNEGWKEVKLVDYLELIIDYRGKTPKKAKSGILTLSAKSVKMGKIDYKQAYFVSEETYHRFMVRGFPRKGDILMTTEAPLGNIARLDRGNICLAQRLITLRGKINELDNGYLMYYLMSYKGQHELHSRATGTTVQGIKRSEFIKVKLILPPLPEQKNIAHILGTLDDKIELNRQMNATLEQMAQALFKSWFVDFDPVLDNALTQGNPIPEALQTKAERRKAVRASGSYKSLPSEIQALFPSHFVFSEALGKWVPEGWEVLPISELVSFIGGGTPKTTVPEYWGGDIPWFVVVDAPKESDIFVIKTVKSITQLGVDKSSTKVLPIGTTIISARGTVGKCAIVGTPMGMGQSCYGIRGKEGIPDYFTYFMIKTNVGGLQKKGHGSVFNTITRKTFETVFVVSGNDKLYQKFDQIVCPYLLKMKQNLYINESLIKLRDTLLPQLISGKLSVADWEAKYKAV